MPHIQIDYCSLEMEEGTLQSMVHLLSFCSQILCSFTIISSPPRKSISGICLSPAMEFWRLKVLQFHCIPKFNSFKCQPQLVRFSNNNTIDNYHQRCFYVLYMVCHCKSDLLLNLHHIPFFVWIVAPVTSPTDSGDPLSSTLNFCNSIANDTVDSNRANWSPTHFLGPPPKGKKEKSAII